MNISKNNYVYALHMCENSADLCNAKEISGVKVCLWHIYDALRSLVPFLQLKKLKPPTLLKVTLLHGCFSCF